MTRHRCGTTRIWWMATAYGEKRAIFSFFLPLRYKWFRFHIHTPRYFRRRFSELVSRETKRKVLSSIRPGGQGRQNKSSIVITLCLVVKKWNAISCFQDSAKNLISSFHHYDLHTRFETFYIIHSWRAVRGKYLASYEQNSFCSIAYRPSGMSQERSRWPQN